MESYIAGTEFALEGLVSHGQLKALALFDKPDPLEGPYFEETIYVTPSRLTPQEQHQFLTVRKVRSQRSVCNMVPSMPSFASIKRGRGY